MTDSSIKQTLAATYDAIAPEYERVVVPVFRPMAKHLLQWVDLRPGWQVLDAGTGTGLLALLGAVRVGKSGKLIGIDAAEGMLAIARSKAARFGFTQCEFRRGDLEALELPDAQFDAILSQFALHYTDPAKSLRELYRVVKPGGALVFHEWADSPNPPNKVLFDALRKYRVTEADDALTWLRAQSERAYDFRIKFCQPAVMKEALSEMGFSGVEARVEEFPVRVPNVEAFFEMALAHPLLHSELSALSAETREQIFSEAREGLRSFETPNGFEWTYHVIAVVARKD